MNKKKIDKYGFTLVELLVTIAIILSIMVLAIVNIVGVSNRKKEEAWVSVKEEIETAATDYFKANEYLFEGLGDTGYGVISVGRLVESDYLNKVTDPRTGKAVSYCTKVNVSKKGRSVSVISVDEINSSATKCDTESLVKVSNAKNAPDLGINKTCSNGDNGWCKKGTDPKVKVTATPVSGSEVVNLETDGCDSNSNLSGDTTKTKTCYIKNETSASGKKLTFTAASADGGITKIDTTIKYDKEAPKVDLTIASNNENYSTKNTKIRAVVTERVSHVASVNSLVDEVKKDIFGNKTSEYSKDSFVLKNENYLLFDKYSGSSKTVKVTAKDTAGNEGSSSKSYTVYKECSETKNGKILEERDECPKCSNNTVSLKVTNEQQLLDKYLNNNKVCGTKYLDDSIYECKNLPPCSRACPILLYSGDDQMKDSKGNYWYTKARVQYIDDDSTYWTWYLNGREYKDCKNEKICYFDVLDEHTVTIKGKNNEKCEDQPIRVYKKLICGIDGKKGDINVEKVEYDEFEKIKIIVSDDVESFQYSVGSKSDTSEASQLVIDEGLSSNTSYKITAKNSQGFTYECSGTISLKVPPKPDCSSSKIVVESGTKGDNGWYKEKDIKLKIKNKKSDLNYSFVTSQGETGSSTLTITKEGTSAVTLKAQNTYGVSTTCDTATYKLDKTPPKLVTDDFNNYDRNIKQYKGSGTSNKIFDVTLKTKNLCLINIGGGYEPPTPSFTFSDNVSGVETTSYNNPFPGANRWCTPIRVRYQFTAKDIAGNVKTVNSSNIFTVAYILSGSKNFYNPCSESNYAAQYSDIFLEKRDGETLEPKNDTCYSTNNNWVQYDTNRRKPSW